MTTIHTRQLTTTSKYKTAKYHKLIKRKIRIYMIMIFGYVPFNFEMNFLLSMQWAAV